ncbi:unnamed protein product [Caenorhabditis angaria]|uniref:SH2 domain-containing protein n=1 Tax=Caenorhabditis angaria TaxID=860376 RepID=A0A9P1J0D7_9PELO|nr:unnamed protein product [Caenorhabditis angaria]
MSIDPESSWSNSNAENDATCEIIRSGVTFHVKFYGYVPINISISKQEKSKKDRITKACIQTVVRSEQTEDFKTIFNAEKVSSFVRLDCLNANMLITANTISLFYIEGKNTRLIARYLTDDFSFATHDVIDSHQYFGFIVKSKDKRECIVLKLTSAAAKNNMIQILKTADGFKKPSINSEARLKPAQHFNLTKQMSPYFHGYIEQHECERLLTRVGDFLFRASRDPNFKGFLIVIRKAVPNKENESFIDTMKKTTEDIEMFNILKRYQSEGTDLKRPIMKLSSI